MYSLLRRFAKHSPLGTVVRWWRRKPTDPPLDPIAQQHLAYDRDTAAIIGRVLKHDSSAVDVGAHAGAILQEILATAPHGKHHAFEPLPHLAKQLREHFPTVAVHQQALGETTGTTTFLHVVNDPGYSGLRRRDYDRPDPLIEELTVEVVRLDDVLGASEQIAFIKLDLEGGEFHALRGALKTILRSRPVIVFEAARRSTGCYGVRAPATCSTWLNKIWIIRSGRFVHGSKVERHIHLRRSRRTGGWGRSIISSPYRIALGEVEYQSKGH